MAVLLISLALNSDLPFILFKSAISLMHNALASAFFDFLLRTS
nr:MAG TPA: hypothetical protein [Caudoviricetes sp.]